MKRLRNLKLITLGAAAMTLVAAAALPPASASGRPDSPQPALSASQRAHDEIVDFWTPDRRASAVPADVTRPDPRKGKPPGSPGGGGGSGGGDSGTSGVVTGERWTAGGDIILTTGKVFFTKGTSRYVCSGSAVDGSFGSLVLTAGHCVNDGNGGPFHTNWIFYPGYDGGPHEVLGGWTATDLFTTDTWANSANGFRDDAGLAAVVGADPSTSLEAALGSAGVGQMPTIVFDLTPDVDYTSFGYPAAKKYKGATLTYCQGPVSEALDGDATLAMACDMTGGSSGGPWIRDMANGAAEINSLNSYGYRSLKGYMFGPAFDSGEQTMFVGATGSPDCDAALAFGYECIDYAD